VIVLPSPDPSDPELESISLDEPRGAVTFIIMRNRAMCNGDVSALFYVYLVLQRFEALVGGEEILQAQLKKEKNTGSLLNVYSKLWRVGLPLPHLKRQHRA
jgi:hypothetical protein